MIWFIVLGVLVLAAVGLNVLGRRPTPHRHRTRADFARFLDQLVKYGGDGALLLIQHERSPAFVQFAKYTGRGVNLHSGFPDAPWSRHVYEAVRAEIDAAGFAWTEQSTGRSDTTRFLDVDNLEGVEAAVTLADVVLAASGVPQDGKFTLQFQGPFDVQRQSADFQGLVRRWKGARSGAR